jgi:hypothetical protein
MWTLAAHLAVLLQLGLIAAGHGGLLPAVARLAP